MPRKTDAGGPQFVFTYGTVACGATDGTTRITDIIAPCKGAGIVQVVATQKAAGTGSGTFTVAIATGPNSAPTATLLPASAGLVVTAAAAQDVVHGAANGDQTQQALNDGDPVNIVTVKTGTVSGNATLIIGILWRL